MNPPKNARKVTFMIPHPIHQREYNSYISVHQSPRRIHLPQFRLDQPNPFFCIDPPPPPNQCQLSPISPPITNPVSPSSRSRPIPTHLHAPISRPRHPRIHNVVGIPALPAAARPASRAAPHAAHGRHHIGRRRARAGRLARAPGGARGAHAPRRAADGVGLALRGSPACHTDAVADARPPLPRLRGHQGRVPEVQLRLQAVLPLQGRQPCPR